MVIDAYVILTFIANSISLAYFQRRKMKAESQRSTECKLNCVRKKTDSLRHGVLTNFS